MKPDISLATKSGHFNLLPTSSCCSSFQLESVLAADFACLVVPNAHHRRSGLKYNAGVVPSIFLNMEMNALGVL